MSATPRLPVALLLVAAACTHAHTFPPSPRDGSSRWAVVGEQAPELALPALDGSMQRLSSYAGRVVVVDFWATFCGPCRQELPELEALRTRHPDVVILAVSIDDADSDDAVSSFVHDRHLGFTVLRDRDGAGAFRYMKFASTPLTVVVGKDGRLRALHRGYAPPLAVRLEDEVLAALADAPVGP
jgi:thiol-disulfide isomerase/thioredoxin